MWRDRKVTQTLGLVVVGLTASCRNETPALAAGVGSSSTSVEASAAAPSASAMAKGASARVAATHPRDAGKSHAALPLTDEQKKRQPSYDEAMSRGRKATAAHAYDDAIHAFDVAVSANQDGRAEAERGYAYLLSKRYDLALKDFQTAADVPSRGDLLGQILFNEGLAEKAVGRAAEADLAFYQSNRIRPSKAAAQQLAGRSVCPVEVLRTRIPAHPFAGWAEWAHDEGGALSGMYGVIYVEGETEEKAAARLCPGCQGDGPFMVNLGDDGVTWPRTWDVHVLTKHDGRLWDFGPFGSGYDGPGSGEPCWSVDQVNVGAVAGHAYVSASSSGWLRVPMKVDEQTQAMSDCPSGAAWGDCQRICFAYVGHEYSVALDLAKPARVLTVTEENRFAQTDTVPPFDVTITPSATGFELAGAGCSSVPWTP